MEKKKLGSWASVTRRLYCSLFQVAFLSHKAKSFYKTDTERKMRNAYKNFDREDLTGGNQ